MRSGPTKKETHLSEAQSYANLVPNTPVLLEERALDSYHNILFSLTLFYTRHQRWPEIITIISHKFKQARLDAHCEAIGFPLSRVRHIGIDPPNLQPDAGISLAMDEWTADSHGKGDKLANKRRKRNPFSVWQGIFPEDTTDTGGLITYGHGENEVLADATRPW